MSIENLIRKDHRGYCIIFPNYRALDNAQIEEIFSEYGRVTSVTRPGYPRGHHFVRYATREEAENAAENVHRHGIRLSSHRPKHGGTTQRNQPLDSNNNANGRLRESSLNSRLIRARMPVWQHEAYNSNVWKDSSDETSSDDQSRQPGIQQQQQQKDFGQERAQSLQSLAPMDKETEDKSDRVVWEKPLNQRNFNWQTLLKYGFSDDDDIEEKPHTRNNSNNLAFIEKPKVVINAAEVVVGNIPPSFGGAYLLHLFKKYNPLAISYLQVVPNTDRHYCHVYFEKMQDAANVERDFDEFELTGKKLIVLRPCKLMHMSGINKQKRFL